MWPHSARPKQRNNRPIAASIGLVAAVLAVLAFGVLAPGEPSLAAGSGTWTTYHHDARRSGVDPDQTPFSSVSFDWSVPVDGDVYAQPLVWHGHVYVATEENTVFAFDATTGQSVWTQKLGAAVPSTVVPNGCANATPHLGVTSTPVIDPATARMYLVAQEDSPLRYELWTLDLNNGGAPISRQTIDPWPGTPQQQATQNALEVQRGALLLANGYVYVNFGGRAECGQAANTLPDYHGWVVAVPIAGQAGGNKSIEFPLPTGRGAGIWSPGGASLGQGGQVYVATGNSLQQATFDNGESVVKLSPTLDLLDFWAPSDWAALNAGDFDIGSFTPTQLDNGIIFQGGKTGFGYLLRDSALGHIGGQAFVSPQHICGTAVPRSFNTGTWVAPLLYMSCTDGIKALRVTTTGTVGFSKIWDGPVAGYPGSAIFAGTRACT